MQLSAKSLSYGILMGLGLPAVYRLCASLTEREKGPPYADKMKFVGIEVGQSSYNVAIGEPILNNKGDITGFLIIKRRNGITYDNPQRSFDEIMHFLRQNQEQLAQGNKNGGNAYRFIGLASFGPICLDKSSQFYGGIINYERVEWRGANLYNLIAKQFPSIPTEVEIQVNALAYAQFKFGKHGAKESLVYITVGQTVQVGVIAQGRPVHGMMHPQGHIIVERSPHQLEDFKGSCPFHRNRSCLSGMVSNRAIADRLKIGLACLADVQDDSIVWRLIAFYLAQLCLNITLLLSPEVIVIGGGIMNRKLLFLMLQEQFLKLQQGYCRDPSPFKDRIDRYLTRPKLGDDAGVKGAMCLSSLLP